MIYGYALYGNISLFFERKLYIRRKDRKKGKETRCGKKLTWKTKGKQGLFRPKVNQIPQEGKTLESNRKQKRWRRRKRPVSGMTTNEEINEKVGHLEDCFAYLWVCVCVANLQPKKQDKQAYPKNKITPTPTLVNAMDSMERKISQDIGKS